MRARRSTSERKCCCDRHAVSHCELGEAHTRNLKELVGDAAHVKHLAVVKLGLVDEHMQVGIRGHAQAALADVLADPRQGTPPR